MVTLKQFDSFNAPSGRRDRIMSKNLEKLAPCPFCGGNKSVVIETGFDGCMMIYSAISCNCGCYVGPCSSKDEVIEKWNKRYKSEFWTLRSAIFQSFVKKGSPLKEEDLPLEALCKIISDVGHDYAVRKLSKNSEG